MIVISQRRYLPTTVNTLVLKKEDIYFYIHRDVYDKAVILSDRHTLDSLVSLVVPKSNQDVIKWFYEEAPKPINILAPFIGLIDGELDQDMEVCCGVLHAISSVIDVRGFISQPKELRKSISFSLSVKEEYEMAWERFFITSVPYDERNLRSEIMNNNSPSFSSPDRDVVDTDDITKNPDWQELSTGVFYNSVTGETAYVENEEEEADDAEFLANLFGGASTEAVEEVAAGSEEYREPETESQKTKRLLGIF